MNKKNENKNKKNKNLNELHFKNNDEKIIYLKSANTFYSRLLGLMFKKSTDYPLLFKIPERRNNKYESSIHSCFMRFELKLVFIDENNMIYEIGEIKPWKIYVPKKGAKYIIEFDKEKFNDYELKMGDNIEII